MIETESRKYRMARRVLMAEVSEGRVQSIPRLGWLDGLVVSLSTRGMTVGDKAHWGRKVRY